MFNPPPRWRPPPAPIPPYIPALCRNPPVLPPGEPEFDDHDIETRINIEQEGNDPPVKVFPAPTNALKEPFYSDKNFNTNITKKTPSPYGFTTTPPDYTAVTEFESEVAVVTTICPPDNENCNTLQY